MKVLALEPWYGGSHRNFLEGFAKHSRHDIHTITMSARFWKRRMHGAAVTMARKTIDWIEQGNKPDAIFASDMLNIPAFLALTRSHLSDVPIILYLHENQLTYPLKEGKERDYTYAYINYLSCLAADRIVFNSKFHHDEFLDALPVLLRAFPDYNHLHSVKEIREKSSVLHLGMDLKAHDQYAQLAAPRTRGQLMHTPVVLWNQRWEYDKNPEAFFRLMNRLDDSGCSFRLILAGEHFEEQPYEFERAFERYAERIIHYGYAEDFEEYSSLLHRADIIVSTAIHEFFGIAVMEATYCGCHPLLPNRLSYPELIQPSLHNPLLHAPTLYEDDEELFKTMYKILKREEKPLPVETLKEVCKHLDWRQHVAHYDSLLEQVAENVPA